MADLEGAFKRLNATIEREIETLNHPGLAIGITDCERLLFCGRYGLANREAKLPVTPETLFQIGSISKAFTSIALLQLQEQGLLNIDDPVTKYLPWFEVKSEYAPITLRHLMSHTAGIITGSDETPAAATEVWNLRYTRATVPPGEMFHYSNSGYKALGLVLQTILDQSMAEILRQRVLDPLGMTATEPVFTHAIRPRLAVGYESYYDDRPHPCGGLLAPATWFESDTADGSICSTAEDMCCYLRALLQRGAGLLTPESFELLIQPLIPTEDDLHGEHYGLGMCTKHLDGHHIISHSGGMVGYQTHLLADLDAGLGIVALGNSPYEPEKIANFAWEQLAATLDGREIPEIRQADPCAVQNTEDYVGRYRCGDREFILTSQGEHLYLEFEGELALLEPAQPGGFLVPHPSFELFLLYFGRDPNSQGEETTQITEALHGPDVYRREGSAFSKKVEFSSQDVYSVESEHSAEWNAFPGHYRSHNPWYSNFRVVLRKARLLLIEPNGEEHVLHPIEPGLFRVSDDPHSPEFLRFEVIIDGKAQFAYHSGGAYCRTFTP